LKTGKIGSGWLPKSASWLCWLSESVSWLWLAFKIGELALANFQNWRVGSGRLSKALGAALRNLLSNMGKEFELTGFKKLFVSSKAFCVLNG
jgi:hypothetical protein